MNSPNGLRSVLLGLIGAGLGGVLGCFAFLWVARQGFYALALPGALMGLGCGLLARQRSMALAIACGVLAVAVELYCEWRFAPFIKDASLGFFLKHILELRPITQIMTVLGGVFAFWFALGSKGKRI